MNIVYGTANSEVMFATDGPDIIYGLQGSDAVHGQYGKDVFVLWSGEIKEFIIDFEEGRDLIDLRQVGIRDFNQLIQLYEYDTDIVQAHGSTMRLYINIMLDPDARADIDPTDFIFASTPVHNYTEERDVVMVSSNVYQVHFGNGGVDTLNLTRLAASANGSGALFEMDDDVYSTGKFLLNNVTQHFFEFRHVVGTRGADTIRGSAAANTLTAHDGNDVVFGRAGNDTVSGNMGNDTLNGGEGNDRVSGGQGTDLLTGSYGADIFLFHNKDQARDTITDFQDGSDRISLIDWGATRVSDLNITANSDGSLTITDETGDFSFRVRGWEGDVLTVGDLTAADFIFN